MGHALRLRISGSSERVNVHMFARSRTLPYAARRRVRSSGSQWPSEYRPFAKRHPFGRRSRQPKRLRQ